MEVNRKLPRVALPPLHDLKSLSERTVELQHVSLAETVSVVPVVVAMLLCKAVHLVYRVKRVTEYVAGFEMTEVEESKL